MLPYVVVISAKILRGHYSNSLCPGLCAPLMVCTSRAQEEFIEWMNEWMNGWGSSWVNEWLLHAPGWSQICTRAREQRSEWVSLRVKKWSKSTVASGLDPCSDQHAMTTSGQGKWQVEGKLSWNSWCESAVEFSEWQMVLKSFSGKRKKKSIDLKKTPNPIN